jgi:hypothetical protein
VADIADAMKLSIATLYRRIGSIGKLMAGQPASARESQRSRAAAILALLQANTARAHAVAAGRMAKIHGTACCPACENAALEIDARQRATDTLETAIDYLEHMGFFDWVRSSGRAPEFLEMARKRRKPRPKSAVKSGM